jgi:hypothetical protein
MIALNNENETSRDVYLPGTWIDYQTRPFETGDRAAWKKLPASFNFSEMTNGFSAPTWARVAGYPLEQADRIVGQLGNRTLVYQSLTSKMPLQKCQQNCQQTSAVGSKKG